MGKNLENQYSFRCDSETIRKLEFIADKNTRTRNQEMKHIIKKHIDEYEKIHGKIQIKVTKIEEMVEKLPGANIGRELAEEMIIKKKKKNNPNN